MPFLPPGIPRRGCGDRSFPWIRTFTLRLRRNVARASRRYWIPTCMRTISRVPRPWQKRPGSKRRSCGKTNRFPSAVFVWRLWQPPVIRLKARAMSSMDMRFSQEIPSSWIPSADRISWRDWIRNDNPKSCMLRSSAWQDCPIPLGYCRPMYPFPPAFDGKPMAATLGEFESQEQIPLRLPGGIPGPAGCRRECPAFQFRNHR